MNTNESVWVSLNYHGWRVFNEYHQNLGLDPAKFRTYLGLGQWQKFQLWELMHIFGPTMHLGEYVPFEDNEIRFEDPTCSGG